MHARAEACRRTLLQAAGDGLSLDEGEDYPSMTLNLADDVHGGTSGYPLPMVRKSEGERARTRAPVPAGWEARGQGPKQGEN